MVNESARTLALVISAIKNLREIKGSSSREILNYLSSVYDIPAQVVRRQMKTALKRGVSYGILKKNGHNYVLPINSKTKCQEIAAQELCLMDHCRRSTEQNPCCQCKKRRRRARRKRKKRCKCKSKRSRSRRRRRSRRRCGRRKSRRRSRRRSRSRRRCGRGRSRSRRRRRSKTRSRSRSCVKRRRKKKCRCGGLFNRRDHRMKRPTETLQSNEQLNDKKSFEPEVEANDSAASQCSSVSTVSSRVN